MTISVAVTGHTPYLLGGDSRDVSERLRGLALRWLEHNQPREVVSGLAAGWDTAVAEAALLHSIPLVAALAYRGQANDWTVDARQNHERLLASACEVYVYCEEKSHGCYTGRDRWVLERGDLVLALWSGVDGGTGRAVATALKLGKPVINLWDQWDMKVSRPE